MNYIFICGCARSGTTTMTNFLRSNSQIALGRERYNSLYKREGMIKPELFERERFCKILFQDDSHHKTLDSYYENLESRFEQCVLVGDKIPSLYRSYAQLDHIFPNHKIIFMVRNIFDVASSFEARREHSLKNQQAPWPITKDYKQAVSDWNLSLSATLPLKSELHIKIVEYERLYDDDKLLEEILAFLQLDKNDGLVSFWETASDKRQHLEMSRKSLLNSNQKNYVMKNANFSNYQLLVK